ncbi:MAG: tRNA 2-thiouridine(34) synthase MnmA [bacterium]|nr:tRNA 2-thiouridine(34) synthase MnmA [bacterium]
MEEKKKKILVLMSGGVDSSTAAALLHSQGYDIAGVYLKLWDDKAALGEPCWGNEMRDAARVAAKLGVPFDVWDVTEEYKTRVLQNFYSEYAVGRTPNPDVLCNSEIKFGIALERALSLGYEHIATGHYARVHNPPQPSLTLREGDDRDSTLKLRGGEGERYQLYTAVDKNKDQSYFLWRLTQEQLAHVMFPIGEYTKPEVRALAEKFGLHNAEKKDSQGVCFLGKIDLKEFLYRGKVEAGFSSPSGDLKVAATTGTIADVRGNFLGLHDGLAHFTIGQRHGTKLGGTGPYFVVDKDIASNTLIVANEQDEPKYRAVECTVLEVNWSSGRQDAPFQCTARVRYRAPLQSVILSRAKDPIHESMGFFTPKPLGARNDSESWQVTFDEPARAVAPGQSIVFYDGDKIIGGGVIDSVVLNTKLQTTNTKQITNSKLQICNL